jgi:hypothetical protein
MTPLLKPMKDFDPSEPSFVHDRRRDRTLPWSPDFKRSFETYARENEPGVIDYDGLELDGWMDIEEAARRPH